MKIYKNNNVHESVDGILTMSLQSSIYDKRRPLRTQRISITETISPTVKEEPKNGILVFLLPMQDS
jgi:hypothetical protein